jgi:hypothetical protein
MSVGPSRASRASAMNVNGFMPTDDGPIATWP